MSEPCRALRAPTMQPVRPGVWSRTPTHNCGQLSAQDAALAKMVEALLAIQTRNGSGAAAQG